MSSAAALAQVPTQSAEIVYQLSGIGKTYARNAIHALQAAAPTSTTGPGSPASAGAARGMPGAGGGTETSMRVRYPARRGAPPRSGPG